MVVLSLHAMQSPNLERLECKKMFGKHYDHILDNQNKAGRRYIPNITQQPVTEEAICSQTGG